MGTITKRTNPSGAVVWRAQIRINKADMPTYSESKTFSKKSLATEWLKRREAEIEANPDLILGINKKRMPTLKAAIESYLSELPQIGRSKKQGLLLLRNFDIAKLPLDKITRDRVAEYARQRRAGVAKIGLAAVQPATVLQDIQYMRVVIKHAFYVWNLKVSWQEIEFALEGLQRGRIVSRPTIRNRLPTGEELQLLTNHFYKMYAIVKSTVIPMHLIMWLAIYTCRRQDEICRMMLSNYDKRHEEWMIQDIKHPDGSRGNNKSFAVSKNAQEIIKELLQDSAQQGMAKLEGRKGSLVPLKATSISAQFTRACCVLDIHDLRFHDLRHEGATRLAEDGATIPQMQRVTLHDSWSSLQRYVNLRRRGERLEFAEAIKVARDLFKDC
nr:MAG TPA: Integrase [Caudoviricetes sp.]